jgi:hypothetical protein
MMKTRMLTIAGSGIVAATLLVGAVGLVSAQGPGSNTGAGPAAPGRGHGPNATMHAQRHADGETGPAHDQMQAAIAGALGITVEELEAERAAGKTVATIAQERGVSLDAVRAAMQGVHPAAGMTGPGGGLRQGMGPRSGMGGCPAGDQ